MATTLLTVFISFQHALAQSPTVHPDLGKFKLQHDPDKPLIGFYGGIGLRQMPDGTWNGYGQTSEKDVEYLINRCKENGIKRIYGSFQEEDYPSKITPPANPATPDYIALCIRLAHENNIEVYADQPIFAYVLAKNGEFVKQHPHVFTKSNSGEPDTHMLSAAYPEVRKFKRDIFMEWMQNYPIDGIQLDFIRYPYYTKDLRVGYGKHGYDEPVLKAFRILYGCPDDFQPAIDDPRFLLFKREMVTQFIRELRQDMKAAGIDLPVGVYNSMAYGRSDSMRTVTQDWETWEREALVTQHSPMILMSVGMSNMIRAHQSVMEITRPESEVIGAIFLAEGYDPSVGDVPTADMVRDAARRLIKAGCDSLWFCRASEIELFDLWPVVKEISNWSIKEIRAENFDPAYENLVEGWTISHTLRPDKPAIVSKDLTFRPLAHLPLYSLTFEATLMPVETNVASPVELNVLVKYMDGTTETFTRNLGNFGEVETRVAAEIVIETDFAKRVPVKATIGIVLPSGLGDVKVTNIEIQRDLLIQP
jgi:hypothetical protein